MFLNIMVATLGMLAMTTSTKPRKPERKVSPPPGILHLLSIPEVAGRLSVSPREVRTMLARGDLTSVRLGRRRLVPSTDVDRLILRLLDQASGI